MQTIVRKDNNVSLYYLADSKTVNIGSDQTTISEGGTLELIIADCNSSNVTLHTGVDAKSADINDSVTTIPVINSNPFTSSGTVQIGDEKITYTGVDGTNLTGCTRGAASTSAASHSSGDTVQQI